MPISSARPCPFVAGPMITDPSRFVGRREELACLAHRMDGAQPTSVNVVGERRIGKSSLLNHFFQTWEQRVNNPSRFVVVYLDLQAKTPPSETAFYQALGRALVKQPAVQRVASLRQNLLAPPRTHQNFAALLEQFTNHVLLPVFCLDEFEILLKCGDQFTDSFFDQLRGCMNASQLMFILSSRKALDVYAGEHNLTSAFFNLGQVLNLSELTEEAADELVNLPMPGRKTFPALKTSDQQLARQWGGRHPCWLQLAGTELFEARRSGKNTAYARKRFLRQRKAMTEPTVWNRSLGAMLRNSGYSPGKLAEVAPQCKPVLLWIVLPVVVLVLLGYALLTGKLPLQEVIISLLKLILK
jgi:hypothetical protein